MHAAFELFIKRINKDKEHSNKVIIRNISKIINYMTQPL